MEELNLTDIKRISIECQKCGTKTIINIDTLTTTLKQCPICATNFSANLGYQESLYENLQMMKSIEKSVKFKVVCEKEQ